MTRHNTTPVGTTLAVISIFIVVLTIVVRVTHPEISMVTAARTYVFWAAALAPIAVLTDMLARTVLAYPIVQRVAARATTRESS